MIEKMLDLMSKDSPPLVSAGCCAIIFWPKVVLAIFYNDCRFPWEQWIESFREFRGMWNKKWHWK